MKRIAPELQKWCAPAMKFVNTDAARRELRALLRCARVLRRLRAAGGGWDVDARYEADQALAALDRAAGKGSP